MAATAQDSTAPLRGGGPEKKDEDREEESEDFERLQTLSRTNDMHPPIISWQIGMVARACTSYSACQL